jgi:hypothetical protein
VIFLPILSPREKTHANRWRAMIRKSPEANTMFGQERKSGAGKVDTAGNKSFVNSFLQ